MKESNASQIKNKSDPGDRLIGMQFSFREIILYLNNYLDE